MSLKNWKMVIISPHTANNDEIVGPVWTVMVSSSLLCAIWAENDRFAASKDAQAQIGSKSLASPNKMKTSISCDPDLFETFCLGMWVYTLSRTSDKVMGKK